MTAGAIHVEGEVGVEAGRLMSGGQLTIRGAAGPFAASGMKGGTLEIEGDAGERLGGPLSGETVGMSGGLVHVRGDAGQRAGDRLRRGVDFDRGPRRRLRRQPNDRRHFGDRRRGGRSAGLFDGPRHDPLGAGRDASFADVRRLRRA